MRASTINDAMKIAAAYAIAALAREEVPDEVTAAYRGRRLRYGPEYLIPTPFDPRLISAVPVAVAKAAMETGVARRPIVNLERYRQELKSRLDPTASRMQLIIERVQAHPKRVVFAEGEEEKSISAALAWRNQRAGHADPDRPRGPRRPDAAGHGHRPRSTASRSTMPGCPSTTGPTPSSSTGASSASGCCSATASAWSTRAATCSPPAWWRTATPTPWSPA